MQLSKVDTRPHRSFPVEKSQVFIRNLKGQSIAYTVDLSQRVTELKNQIYLRENIPFTEQRLVFSGRQLKNDATLQESSVGSCSTIDLSLSLVGGRPVNVFINSVNGRKLELVIDTTDTFAKLQERTRSQLGWEIINIHYMSMVFSGASHGTIENSIPLYEGIELMVDRLCMDGGFSFASNDILGAQVMHVNFNPSGPSYCQVTKGLNLLGKCENPNCVANKKWVYVKHGMGTFELAELFYTSICPVPNCGREVVAENIGKIGFYACRYTLEGRMKKPEAKFIREEGVAPEGKYTTFPNADNKAEYAYMKVTTRSL